MELKLTEKSACVKCSKIIIPQTYFTMEKKEFNGETYLCKVAHARCPICGEKVWSGQVDDYNQITFWQEMDKCKKEKEK